MDITGSGICQQSSASVTLFNAIPNFRLNSGYLFLTPTFDGSGTIQNLVISGDTLMGTNRVTRQHTHFYRRNHRRGRPTQCRQYGGNREFSQARELLLIDAPFTNFGVVNWTGGGSSLNTNLISLTGVFDTDTIGLVNIESDSDHMSSGVLTWFRIHA